MDYKDGSIEVEGFGGVRRVDKAADCRDLQRKSRARKKAPKESFIGLRRDKKYSFIEVSWVA